MLDPPKVTAETSGADGFALMLETACRDFEVLIALVRNDFSITAADQFLAMRARGAIRMALAKSLVFNAARAFRICERGAQNLNVPSDERKAFLAAMRPILDVRHVNEHGFDPRPGRRGKNSRPSMHFHHVANVILDEVSLNILGEQRILMGPLNLADFYAPMKHMCALAGFARDKLRKSSAT
jgi:hypothetical protein